MHQDLYKQTMDIGGQQEQRRRTLLENQKQKRLQAQDEQRELPEIKAPRFVPTSYNSNKRWQHNFKSTYKSDRTLQLSEWLRERPDELEDWLLVPCPRGQRCMVVACHGRTEMYTKSGRRQMWFHSLLPGDGVKKSAFTILDCVFVQGPVPTFYVLDALVYGNQDLVDCEAQFRFFWLRSKFDEIDEGDELDQCGDRNENRFCLLEHYGFENAERVAMALQRHPLWPEGEPELDGFLFYHKEASYTFGTTPLVGWLFAFMVKDVLGLQVSDEYKPPATYKQPLEFMDEFDEAQKKKQKRFRTASGRQASAMDTQEHVPKPEEKVVWPEEAFEDANEGAFEEALEAQEPSLNALLDAERKLEMEGVVAEESPTEPLDC